MHTSTKLRRAFIVLAVLFLGGCVNSFSLVDKGFTPKGESIAVVPGINNEMNHVIAALISGSLVEQSRYAVLSPKGMNSRLKDQPVNVQGPYKSAYFEIDVDWSKTDIGGLEVIQDKLKTDYLYVLWAPNAVRRNNNDIVTINMVAQMFKYPGMELVGQGQYRLRASENGPHYLELSTKNIAIDLAEKTAMLKK